MKAKQFYVVMAVVIALSLVAAIVPASPAMADTTTTLTLPSNVYRPAEFIVSSTTTNSGAAYDNVRFKITVSGPVDFTGNRADTFTITKVNGDSNTEGINDTFLLVGGDWVGYWGPPGGFPLPDSSSATSNFTIQMDDVTTAPLGNYDLTVELVYLTPDPDVTLVTATDSFSLSDDTLYVGTTEYQYQFNTIQEAIDASSPGDTIIVSPGNYTEQLFIDWELIIKSTGGAANTIIDGTGLEGRSLEVEWDPGNATTIYPVVWIDAANVVFGDEGEGFTITGANLLEWSNPPDQPPEEMGVGMLNLAAGCTIEENTFGNNTLVGYMGMYEFGPSSNQVLDNEFCENVMALWLMGGGSDTILGNTFIENLGAIIVQQSNDNDIVGNNLNSNSMGIDVSGSHGNTISGNDISDTTGGTWEGMDFPGVAIELKDGCNENTISGNTISKDTEGHAADCGIRLSDSSNNEIVGNNDISDCQYDGILFNNWSNDNNIEGNTVGNCTRGIALEGDVNNNHIVDNEVYSDYEDWAGIYIGTPLCGNEIGRSGEGNTIYGYEVGILVVDSRDETIAGNTVYYCGGGIVLESSRNITVEDNITWLYVFEDEVGNDVGIYLENSWENTIRGNDISYNEEKGLFVSAGSDNNFVAANTIYYNGHGIWIAGNNTSICGNDIRDNAGELCGVYLTAAADWNEIHCNNIVGNTPYGMYKESGNATNAQHNWWGDPTGPSGEGPGTGVGDAVGGPIDFSDWAETEFAFPDTTAPVIADTAAVPATVSLLDTDFLSWAMGNQTDNGKWYNYWFSVGPSYTDLIVDTGCDPCEACGVSVDLSALLLGILPADFDEVVAQWDDDKQNEWQNWMNELANTNMDYRDWWDGEGQQYCYWDYELWLDDLLIGGPWGDWCLAYFFDLFEDGEEAMIEFMDMVFTEFRLGEFELPVTAFDCSGNENTDYHITLAVVDFQLPMKKGWNIRSTPISLDNSSLYSIVHLGDGLNSSSILRWNAQQERWEQYAEPPSVYYTGWYYGSTKVAEAVVEPLEAYYFKLNDNDQLGFIINRDSSGALPARPLYAGWNLVGLAPDFGHWVFDGMPIQQALATIYLVEEDLHGWSVATSPLMLTLYDEEFYYNGIPLEGKPAYEKWFLQEPWHEVAMPGHEGDKVMTTGGGYWVFMTNPGELGGYSYTPLPWLLFFPYW